MLKKITFFFVSIFFAITLYNFLALSFFFFTPHKNKVLTSKIIVSKGETFLQVASKLEKEGVISNKKKLIKISNILNKSNKIKAGAYRFSSKMSPYKILDDLTKGNFILNTITFIEGWTFEQYINALNTHQFVQNSTKNMNIKQILDKMGIQKEHPEGLFAPDTYHFSAGTTDLEILTQSYNNQKNILNKLWLHRDKSIKIKNSYQALILASIIEKETGSSDERRLISAVFNNRLKKRMRLQADPTVIYGLKDRFLGNLKKKHLREDNPYNTYKIYGLPPTPIAMPGKESIMAALNPEISDSIYFVSTGNGKHYFSKTLKEHNKAVAKFQKRK